MVSFFKYIIVAVVTTTAIARPASQSCGDRYPTSNHTIALYPPKIPALDNFAANITIGSQTLRAVLDTGSSQTWFMQTDTQCFSPSTDQPISAELCGYHGPRYRPDASFKQIPDTHLNASYANGDGFIAIDGYTSVSLGGIQIPNTVIGLGENVSTSYNVDASGLIGLAYSGLTNMYPGNDPSTDMRCSYSIDANDTGCNTLLYAPLQTSLFANGQTPAVLSFALSRSTSSGGIMTIGGIPDLLDPQVNVTTNAFEATVPLVKAEGKEVYTFYLIPVDGFHFPGASAETEKVVYEVDIGTVPNIVNESMAEAYNARYDPPAWFNQTLGQWLVQCNATAAEFSVEIGGVNFEQNPKDMILGGEEGYPFCLSGLQNTTDPDSFILGSAFARSILAVFDIDKNQMTIASRVYYEE